jgi:hypothetical protein
MLFKWLAAFDQCTSCTISLAAIGDSLRDGQGRWRSSASGSPFLNSRVLTYLDTQYFNELMKFGTQSLAEFAGFLGVLFPDELATKLPYPIFHTTIHGAATCSLDARRGVMIGQTAV